MADNKLAEAIDVVARTAVSNAYVAGTEDDMWGDFPEVGEDDWNAVAKRMDALMLQLRPAEEEYHAAYEFLTARSVQWQEDNPGGP